MAHSAAHGATTHSGDTAYERQTTFHSLRYPNYRYMWIGQVGASASMWMEQVARPLLIYELTGSAVMLGLLAATRMIPQLLVGIWAGVLADRMDKKQLLGLSQGVTFAMHLVTALLILTGVIDVWMVFLTTFISGSSMAFNQPVRQSLIARIVPPEALQNAVALNSAAVNFMRIGGAGLAGFLLAGLAAITGSALDQYGYLYLLQGAIYVLVIATTMKMRLEKFDSKSKQGSILGELFEGFRYAKHDKTILFTLMLSLVIFIWGVPYQSVFIPLLATEKLGMGSTGTGLMIAFAGLGALVGSLAIATIGGSMQRRGAVMMTVISAFAIALFVLANAPTIVIAIPALLLSGAMQTSYMSIAHAYVLGRTAPELHGRIMSLFSLDRGLVPLGATIGGVLAEVLGPSGGLMVMAAVCLSTILLIALLVPSVRRIQ